MRAPGRFLPHPRDVTQEEASPLFVFGNAVARGAPVLRLNA
jgi:hypothetical protein